MIWVIANKKEEDGSFPTYKHYKQAFEDGRIDIYCAGPDDDFSFLKKHDIAFVRTRDEEINQRLMMAQRQIGFASTLEMPVTNFMTYDKETVKALLEYAGIPHPKSVYALVEGEKGRKLFVKPRYGECSIGIDDKSLCTSTEEVISQLERLQNKGIEPMVEEYIDGFDVTTAVINVDHSGILRADTIRDLPQNDEGFRTYDAKKCYRLDNAEKFCVRPYDDEMVNEIAKKVFELIGAQHYLRIDFRVADKPYVIDINMIPGIAPVGPMSMCLGTHGVEYHDMIRMLVDTAS